MPSRMSGCAFGELFRATNPGESHGWAMGCVIDFGLSKEGCSLPLHKAVQRGLGSGVPVAVDRSAIRRPLGLPANGLRAGLPKW